MKFSVIIPVYNRPEEVDELLRTLLRQTRKNFEVVVVEDGSSRDCRKETMRYKDQLELKYFYKANSGPGQTRNFGARKAAYDYIIFFDSDCLIPKHYFAHVEDALRARYVDAFGGPDMAHRSFTPVQKAISYSMTSFFTTGGIRGGSEKVDTFYPRSFNMGLSREVFQKTGGFSEMRFGEDLDLSMRILKNGFSTRLLREAYVFHKRRTDYRKFFRQVFNSGIARINLNKRHPGTLKIVHTFPSLFLIGSGLLVVLTVWKFWFILPLLFYALLVFADAAVRYSSVTVAAHAILASFVQLFGYGAGFLNAFWKRVLLKRGEFRAYEKNFYD